jgi:hypothetical protein
MNIIVAQKTTIVNLLNIFLIMNNYNGPSVNLMIILVFIYQTEIIHASVFHIIFKQ